MSDSMTTLRRLVVLWLLMFWQGGFVFYAAVVVHVGAEVLGSPLDQGWITQRVTNWLNLAGANALAALAWDIAADSSRLPCRRRRWLMWLFLVVALTGLAGLHVLMDRLLDHASLSIADHDAFYSLHRWYLWVSTAQWLGSVLLSWWTIEAWSAPSSLRPDRVL